MLPGWLWRLELCRVSRREHELCRGDTCGGEGRFHGTLAPSNRIGLTWRSVISRKGSGHGQLMTSAGSERSGFPVMPPALSASGGRSLHFPAMPGYGKNCLSGEFPCRIINYLFFLERQMQNPWTLSIHTAIAKLMP